METVVIHELSNGMIALIILVAGWLGLCFVVGMKGFATHFIDRFIESMDKMKKILNELEKQTRG